MTVAACLEDRLKNPVVTLRRKDISSTCSAVLEAITNGLPEEAHTYEVYNYVLEECIEIIKTRAILK